MLKYSNGWGHFLISVLFVVTGLLLIFFSPDGTMKGIGVGILTTVVGAWFVPGAAKQMATQIQAQVQEAVPAPVPAPDPRATVRAPAVRPAPPLPAVQLPSSPPAPAATRLPESIPQDGEKGQ